MTENEIPSAFSPSANNADDEEHLPPEKKVWLEKFRDFVARQTSHNPNFDDSRESIYPVRDHDREES